VRKAIVRDDKLLRGAYREVQSKLMQFQPRVRWKNGRRFCDRLNSLIFCTSDKKKKEKRSTLLQEESNYCRSLISYSCSVENNREQTITKELRSRWKKVTRVRIVLAYFCQDAT